MPILTIHVPDDAWEGVQEPPETLSQEIRLAAAIFWAKQGKISVEKAAEFAEITELEMAEALAASPSTTFSRPPRGRANWKAGTILIGKPRATIEP